MPHNKFFVNEFQKTIWQDGYRYGKETIESTMRRLADTIFANETPELREELYKQLIERKIVFGGRVIANIGTSYKNVFAFNCFGLHGSTKPVDSMMNIFNDFNNLAQVLKSEGGVGTNFNSLRPKGTIIKGIGVGTPGPIAFMEIQDKIADVITRGSTGEIYQSEGIAVKSKIRKGAMMGVMSIDHPSIIDFIEAKRIPNKLTKFNMSVLITDKFMNAVLNDSDWDLWFPDISFSAYDNEWDGDFQRWEESSYPKVVYQTVKAKWLWNLLIENMYRRNEPGIIFIDNANKLNNLWYHGKYTTTNPCVHPNTLILTNRGWIKISNLTKKYLKDKTIKIITQDKENILHSSELHFVGITKKNDNILKVSFSNGEYILVNKTHKLYVEEFEEKIISDIKIGDEIYGANKLKVVDIENTNINTDVYDLTTTPNFNFFSVLNREEDYSDDQIIINGFIKYYQYDLVKTKIGVKFACDLSSDDELV